MWRTSGGKTVPTIRLLMYGDEAGFDLEETGFFESLSHESRLMLLFSLAALAVLDGC